MKSSCYQSKRQKIFRAVLLKKRVEGSCLQCYQCNSESDPKCKDPFSSKGLVDCNTPDSYNYNRQYLIQILPQDLVNGVTGAPRYCHKIVMQNGATVRTCLDGNPTDLNHSCRLLNNQPSQASADPSKRIKYCSVCDKDRCNGAGSIAASVPLAIFALISSYLYSKQ
ncbi:unnamed protein product [Euphydryas editha]|uniref:Protein quiver n=1 Tax=Euphydryas editha TaxID=104508 RepID=A0AAU9U4F3_EUPED|nr:unnamed protein product [Euphydryas editha]